MFTKTLKPKNLIIVIAVLLALTYLLFFSFQERIEADKVESITEKNSQADFEKFITEKKKLSLKQEELSFFGEQKYHWNKNTEDYDVNKIENTNEIENKDKGVSKILEAEEFDLNNNQVIESYELESGKLTIKEKNEIIWESPNHWWIDKYIIADSTNDGKLNINLSLWKSGNFGSSKPFWIEENDMSIKNHFFVLSYNDSKITEVWGSSNLTKPNCDFLIEDINNDEKNDLIVLEGDYQSDLNCLAKYLAVWTWNGWGFSNEWRSEESGYLNLKVEEKAKKSYIIVNTY